MAIEVDSFRGIDFDKWLEIILKVCFTRRSLVVVSGGPRKSVC